MNNHIIVKGKITKRTYCPSCFSIITWDSSSVEGDIANIIDKTEISK